MVSNFYQQNAACIMCENCYLDLLHMVMGAAGNILLYASIKSSCKKEEI